MLYCTRGQNIGEQAQCLLTDLFSQAVADEEESGRGTRGTDLL